MLTNVVQLQYANVYFVELPHIERLVRVGGGSSAPLWIGERLKI